MNRQLHRSDGCGDDRAALCDFGTPGHSPSRHRVDAEAHSLVRRMPHVLRCRGSLDARACPRDGTPLQSKRLNVAYRSWQLAMLGNNASAIASGERNDRLSWSTIYSWITSGRFPPPARGVGTNTYIGVLTESIAPGFEIETRGPLSRKDVSAERITTSVDRLREPANP